MLSVYLKNILAYQRYPDFGKKPNKFMFKKPLITIIKKLLIPYRQTRFLKDMTVNIDYAVVILTGIEMLALRGYATLLLRRVIGSK